MRPAESGAPTPMTSTGAGKPVNAAPIGRARLVLAFALVVFVTALAGAGVRAAPPRVDLAAGDAADALRTPWLETLMRAVTALGEAQVAMGVALLACAWLARRGRHAATVVLALAVPLTAAAVTAVKALTGRARPPDGRVATDSAAFPSGHAAASVIYLLVGLMILAYADGSRAWRVAAASAGATLALGIGLSRVYLDVHWLTDVVGGWSLAMAVYAAVTVLVDGRSSARRAGGA